jgi:hypothetical protein
MTIPAHPTPRGAPSYSRLVSRCGAVHVDSSVHREVRLISRQRHILGVGAHSLDEFTNGVALRHKIADRTTDTYRAAGAVHEIACGDAVVGELR